MFIIMCNDKFAHLSILHLDQNLHEGKALVCECLAHRIYSDISNVKLT